MGVAGRHKDPLQKHLSGLCPFLPPSREQSKQASLGQGWKPSRVLLSKGGDGPARGRQGWGNGIPRGRKRDLDQ